MGLLNNIAGAFNPSRPVAAPPPPAPAAPAIAPVSAGDAMPVQQDMPGTVPAEPQSQPQTKATGKTPTLQPEAVLARADAIQEIRLHQFDAVRLRPAAPIDVGEVQAKTEPAKITTTQVQSASAEPTGAAKSGVDYRSAFSQLMAEATLSTQQRILRSL